MIFRQLKLILAICRIPALYMLMFCISIECCARIDDAVKYGAPLIGEYSDKRLRDVDPVGLPYNLPNAQFEKWRHNSLGFRGPEVSPHKTPGIVRIVCLGASESYGLYESPEKEWPSQLQTKLSPRYEVVNASIVGLNLRLFGNYLNKNIFNLQPDYVVLVINPLFYINGMIKKTSSSEVLSSAPQAHPTVTSDSKSPMSISLPRLRSPKKAKQVLKQALLSHFPNLLIKYQLWDTQKQVEIVERMQLKGRAPLAAIPDVYLDSFRNDMITVINILRENNVNVVLTTYPTLIGNDNEKLYPEIFLDLRKSSILLTLDGINDAVIRSNMVVADIAKKYRVTLVDADAEIPKSTEFFADAVHYTDKGAARFAESVSKKLQ